MMTLTDLDRRQLDGARVVASISGGKDSTAMALWLREVGIQPRYIFADTGWEAAETYDYIDSTLRPLLGEITTVQGRDGGLVPLVRRKAMFPSRLRRFCTDELKVRPIHAELRALVEAGADVVSAVGVRASESAARAKLPRWDGYNDRGVAWSVWRPLIAWSEADVIAIHTRHGVAPNPLYMRGASRVGCWPCIFARKREIRLIADLDPDRIDEVRELERELDGPTFFHRPTIDDSPHTLIDEVVEWARTDRGGRQMLLMPEPADEGCMRWGLCEPAGRDEGES